MPSSREQKARRVRQTKRLLAERAKDPVLAETPLTGSDLEIQFALSWEGLNLGITLEREYFPIKGRNYRLDFAHPETMVGVEINGGTWARRRQGHSTGSGIQRDYTKANYCQMNGWVVFLLDSKMVDGHKTKDGLSLNYWQLAIADFIRGRLP